MINQNIIVYQFSVLYKILKEIEQDIKFNIIEVSEEKILNSEIEKFQNYLVVSNKKNINIKNQLIIYNFPLKIEKIIEKFNIELIKNKFIDQSKIKIKSYNIDLNSKEISFKDKKFKLTEKEIRTIVYLSKAKKVTTIDELQTEVWGYQSDLETHTVETHIYRLRKKFFNIFGDKNFISSEKNGYKIK